jgi:hypothetical protein
MYLKCSVLIQRQVFKNFLLFTVDITFSKLMFQIFTRTSGDSLYGYIGYMDNMDSKNSLYRTLLNSLIFFFNNFPT